MAGPVRKISIFLTFSKFHFSGLTKILVYAEYQKRIFSGLFSLKIPVRKHTIFWKIGKFLESFDFLDTLKSSLSWSQKHSFLPKIQKKNFSFLICPKNSLHKIFEVLKKTMAETLKKFSIFLALSKFHRCLKKNGKMAFL